VALQVRGARLEQAAVRRGLQPFGELAHVAAIALERVAREAVVQPQPVGEAVEQPRAVFRQRLHAPAASA
jgi:hypothetical protein